MALRLAKRRARKFGFGDPRDIADTTPLLWVHRANPQFQSEGDAMLEHCAPIPGHRTSSAWPCKNRLPEWLCFSLASPTCALSTYTRLVTNHRMLHCQFTASRLQISIGRFWTQGTLNFDYFCPLTARTLCRTTLAWSSKYLTVCLILEVSYELI